MRPQLILVEGLPGSGKSTVAQLVQEVLQEMNISNQLVLEGDLDHPADYDGTAYYSVEQYEQLIHEQPQYADLLQAYSLHREDGVLVFYRKLKNQAGNAFPDDLVNQIFEHDIYELLLHQNRRLITEKWQHFADQAALEEKTWVFECCFMQNPITIGKVLYAASDTAVTSYVNQLARIVEPLHPLLIYVEQEDVGCSFRKAADERPLEWLNGFLNYYTQYGIGKEMNATGIDGAIQVLEVRKQLELKIYDQLTMNKVRLDNTQVDREAARSRIQSILERFLNEERTS